MKKYSFSSKDEDVVNHLADNLEWNEPILGNEEAYTVISDRGVEHIRERMALVENNQEMLSTLQEQTDES